MVRGFAPGADAGRGEALAAPVDGRYMPRCYPLRVAYRERGGVPGVCGDKKTVPIFSWHSTYIGKVYYLINTSNKQCI